ncbi:WXG100 family type VII secretion target [Lentzea sp. HUAS TT2]|uniref:WXG100 family type VII secretion target n=1 Tax=Lentzea sp. HUAS TT2 TaxID=3447454 RepID=UPI003F6EF574
MTGGVSNGYQDIEDPNVALRATPDNRPGRQTVKELIEAAGWKIQGVNWIYQQVTGDDLVRDLVMPLAGDFEKIDANAAAWDRIAKALDNVRHNVNNGIGELSPSWDGGAAQSFENRMRRTWTTAIEWDSQVAKFIGDRFKNMASSCRSAAKLALTLLDKICDKLMKAAMTAWIPLVGWGRAVWMVYDVVNIVDQVRKLIQSMQTLIEGVQGMINGIKLMGTALSRIPDVRDVNDFFDVVDTWQDGTEKFGDGTAAVGSGAWGMAKSGYKARGKYIDAAKEERWAEPSTSSSGGGE